MIVPTSPYLILPIPGPFCLTLPHPTSLPQPTPPHHILSFPISFHPTLPYPTLPCPSLPTPLYRALPSPTVPYPTVLCPSLPSPSVPFPTLTLPCPTLPYPTVSFPTLPYRAVPYPTMSSLPWLKKCSQFPSVCFFLGRSLM